MTELVIWEMWRPNGSLLWRTITSGGLFIEWPVGEIVGPVRIQWCYADSPEWITVIHTGEPPVSLRSGISR